jgi:broad specificity phosphatase PhoE
MTGQRPNLEDPRLLDPPLVYQGKQQALEAGELMNTWWKTIQLGDTPELVITSPLTRCIQTASLIFLPGDGYTSDRRRTEPRIFCTELVREAFGMHYPDKRREKSILQKYWPSLEMDPQMTEVDAAWRPDARENMADVQRRISSFWDFLVQQPEKSVVVVTHGVWMEACIHQYCAEALDHGRRRVYNCDMFAMECRSQNGKFLSVANARQIR